jgi:prolipoprotein diacylglyceryltransferase
VFGLLYSVNRFIIEIFRGDSSTFLGMTMSQWISIVLFIISGVLYVYLGRKGACTPLPVKTDISSGTE